MDLLDRLRLERPIVQAGLGGGIARGALAGAVSAAGGLGTVGIMSPGALAREIRSAQDRAVGKPVAVNLLVPFAKPAHVRACVAAGVDAVVLFSGFAPRLVAELQAAGILVMHQVGTVAQARRAVADGADALIAQGSEAGGHLLGEQPLAETLPRVTAVADGRPVLAAGGLASAERVRKALAAGASAAVAGTRFLLTDECHAHPEYKRRVLGAQRTLQTQLFGFGWPARHRVVPNAATQHWCSSQDAGSAVVRAINKPTGRIGSLLPLNALEILASTQRVPVPLFSPGPALREMPTRVVECTALYAGVVARELHDVAPAAEAVRQLIPES